MRPIVVAGGCYIETCEEPRWRAVYGSGGRAAHALIGQAPVHLHTYFPKARAGDLQALAAAGVEVHATNSESAIAFAYFHPLSDPVMAPERSRIVKPQPLHVEGDAVLRFGFVTGEAIVAGRRVVYDPQSVGAFAPFEQNGSSAEALALVLNADELRAATRHDDLDDAARELLLGGVDVVIAKAGAYGAVVYARETQGTLVPAFWSDAVFKIGTGDIFSAAFTHAWAYRGEDPLAAAYAASRSVAHYAAHRSLPLPSASDLPLGRPIRARPRGQVNLIGSTARLADRWLFEEAAWRLGQLGSDVRRWDVAPQADVGKSVCLVLADQLGTDALESLAAQFDVDRLVVLSETGIAVPVGAHVTTDFATALYWACWLS